MPIEIQLLSKRFPANPVVTIWPSEDEARAWLAARLAQGDVAYFSLRALTDDICAGRDMRLRTPNLSYADMD